MSFIPPLADDAVIVEDFELLKSLTSIAACTGNEAPITSFIQKILDPICDELYTDSIGNLFAIIKGTSPRTVLLDAHTDEIGFQVVLIESDGFLRIASVGGQNPRVLPGSRVIIHSNRGGSIPGVIGEKPIHHLSAEDRKKTSEISSLFVDCGFTSKNDAEKFIDIGDFATLDQSTIRYITNTRATGKSFDDRAGCFVLIRVLQWIKNHGPLNSNIVAVFSAQEEIGVRGGIIAAYRTHPDEAFVIEVDHALDYPGASKNQYGDTKLGNGPVIPIGPNIAPKMSRRIIETAKESNIAIQTIALPNVASNNARIIQISREGVPVGLIKIPLRYMHTAVETLDLKDLHNVALLLYRILIKNP